MSIAINEILLNFNFRKIHPNNKDSHFFIKAIGDKEYKIYTFTDTNDIFIYKDNEEQSSEIIHLYDHEIEPYFNAIIRKDKIKMILDIK